MLGIAVADRRERERERERSIDYPRKVGSQGRAETGKGRPGERRTRDRIGEKKDTAAAKRDPSESRVSPQVGRFDFDTRISFYPSIQLYDLGTNLWIYEV